jgi:hypothetical protein
MSNEDSEEISIIDEGPFQECPALLDQETPASPPSSSISATTLCTLARSDLRHDFHGKQLGLDVAAAGSYSIPETDQCEHFTEDGSLRHFLGITRDPVDATFIIPNAGPLHNDYYCIPKISYTDLYEGGFKQVTPDGDIYLIVDTYTVGFGKALTALKELPALAPGPTLYWVQNRQTLYDPGNKSDPTTPAGTEIFENNPHVRFCWEDTSASTFSAIEQYPPWELPLTDEPVSIDSLPNKNTLFYSKNDTYMVLQSDLQNSYRAQDSVCIMKTANPVGNRRTTVIMNSAMASKTGVQFAAGTYSDLVTALYALLGMIGAQDATRLNANVVEQKLKEHHYAAKRLGDQGQALSCLKAGQTMVAEKVRNGVQVGYSRPTFERKVTNGINCFVTIDRVALCGAILYQTPVALFQYSYKADRLPNENYAALFIRKNLLNEATQERLRREGLLSRVMILKQEICKTYMNFRDIVEELKSIIREGRLPTLYQVYRERLLQELQKNRIVKSQLRNETDPNKRETIFQKWVIALYTYVPTFTDITTRYHRARERIDEQIHQLQNHINRDRTIFFPQLTQLDARIRLVLGDPASVVTPSIISLVNTMQMEIQAIESERDVVKSLETAIYSFKHTFDTLNEEAAGKLALCGGDVQNIKRSSFFLPGRYRTARPFLLNAACYTTSTYLSKIKEMIISLYPGQPQYVQDFLSVINTCLTLVQKAERQTGDLTKANLITTHLYSIIPELKLKPGLRKGGRRRGTRHKKGKKGRKGYTRKTRGGSEDSEEGPKATRDGEPYIQIIRESIYKEMTIRTVCAILYAAYAHNQEQEAARKASEPPDEEHGTIKVYDTIKKNTNNNNNNDTEKREITDLKGVLATLLTKLDPEKDPKEVTEPYKEPDTEPDTEISYYYIPFIQEQITQIDKYNQWYGEGLQLMYHDLLHEADITMSSHITALVTDFMSKKQTYKSFFPVPNGIYYDLPTNAPQQPMRAGPSVVAPIPDAIRKLLSPVGVGGTVQSKKSRRLASRAWNTIRKRR